MALVKPSLIAMRWWAVFRSKVSLAPSNEGKTPMKTFTQRQVQKRPNPTHLRTHKKPAPPSIVHVHVLNLPPILLTFVRNAARQHRKRCICVLAFQEVVSSHCTCYVFGIIQHFYNDRNIIWPSLHQALPLQHLGYKIKVRK